MRTSGTIRYQASCQLPVCEPETTRPAQLMRVLGMLLHSWEYLIGKLFYIPWMQDYHFLQSLKHLALLWHNPLLDISKNRLLLMLGSRNLCGTASMADSRRKTVLCRHFANGMCRKGSACPFAHGDQELSKRSGKDQGTCHHVLQIVVAWQLVCW